MKKLYLVLLLSLIGFYYISAQTLNPITAQNVSEYNAAFDPGLDSATKARMPYATDLGVRKSIVADANGDGKQEIIAVDYSNYGRVHVIAPSESDPKVLEVIWSSKIVDKIEGATTGSSPRIAQVGDLDGDGKMEIIFEQNYTKSIVVYEWIDEMQLWGTEPAFMITNQMMLDAGVAETAMRFTRESILVGDFDDDGRDEFIPDVNTPARDVYVFYVDGSFPGGSANVYLEGGDPTETTNGRNWAKGSFYNAVAADIDGDGKKEIVNHHFDKFGFWSIDVNGPDSYTYPDTSDPRKADIYHQYSTDGGDWYSLMGVRAVDVNGDGQSEIVGSTQGSSTGTDIVLFSFSKADTGVYIWKSDAESVSKRFGIIARKDDLAQLGGLKTSSFYPVVPGDLNKDGKDEIYTGGATGVNVVAIQYKGEGSLLDPNSYVSNLVFKGEGNDVYRNWNIYHGKVVYDIDTIQVTPDSIKIDTVNITFDPSQIDTVKTEVPFTSYVFADHVDLDNDGNYEIVLSQQSIYDSVVVTIYNWDTDKSLWRIDTINSHKIYNNFRKNIVVLEYTGGIGVKDEGYTIVTPEDYKLEQNYPNPFNPTTNISFTLPIDKKITLKVYDMLGKEVKTLINGENYSKGNYKILWDGKNNSGMKVASGNYIARLEYGTFFKAIKMTLLK
jgi:hypothetical protein